VKSAALSALNSPQQEINQNLEVSRQVAAGKSSEQCSVDEGYSKFHFR
jgi:DNA-binding CsgD family transcriptional regulator